MKPCSMLQTASRFIDQALSVDEESRFKTHLDECPDCQEFVGQAMVFRHTVEADTVLDFPSPELERRMMVEANRAVSVKPGLFRQFQEMVASIIEPRMVVYATAALIMGLTLGGIFQKLQKTAPAPAEQYLMEAAPLFETEYPGSITTVLSHVEGRGL